MQTALALRLAGVIVSATGGRRMIGGRTGHTGGQAAVRELYRQVFVHPDGAGVAHDLAARVAGDAVTARQHAERAQMLEMAAEGFEPGAVPIQQAFHALAQFSLEFGDVPS